MTWKEMSGTQRTAHSTQIVLGRSVCCLLSAVCCLLLSGCIRRSLTIQTDPSGALVYVNDRPKGQSPMTYDFVWYGGYQVTIEKEGYQRLTDHQMLRAPAYFWMPLDLVMELLPFPVRDARTWSYTLVKAPELAAPVPPPLRRNELAVPDAQTEQPEPDADEEAVPETAP